MHRILKSVVIVGLSAGLVVGCDQGPTDITARELDAILAASGAGTPQPGALAALFRESVAAVEQTQGRAGVEALLGDWRRLQDELKTDAPTAGRPAIEAKLAAIHAEELRIVHQVLGNSVITRLVAETNLGLAIATAHLEAAAAAGHDITTAAANIRQIREKLAATTNALSVQSHREALDHAAEAAGLIGGLRHQLIELQRIDGLEVLFPRALAHARSTRGAVAADRLAARVGALNARTRAALRAGDREGAHESLALARAEQIRIVRDVLDEKTVARLIADVDGRAQKVAAVVEQLDQTGRDVVKIKRMLREASDLHRRAADALAQGDGATALDLGSHAAGLLNTLQHLTWH